MSSTVEGSKGATCNSRWSLVYIFLQPAEWMGGCMALHGGGAVMTWSGFITGKKNRRGALRPETDDFVTARGYTGSLWSCNKHDNGHSFLLERVYSKHFMMGLKRTWQKLLERITGGRHSGPKSGGRRTLAKGFYLHHSGLWCTFDWITLISLQKNQKSYTDHLLYFLMAWNHLLLLLKKDPHLRINFLCQSKYNFFWVLLV